MMGRWVDLIGSGLLGLLWPARSSGGDCVRLVLQSSVHLPLLTRISFTFTSYIFAGKKNTPESHNSLSSDTMINTWELMNGHDDEDWIHLHSKPKHPLWKHLAEESFLSGLDLRILKERVIFPTTWQKHQTGHMQPLKSNDFNQLTRFRVAVEERDILMYSHYRTELQISLGEEKPILLP
ncbi:unnamed protein product [Brassica rapa]|uniref:Uncharacterized protein n=2 Tax=Brassica campestris TaxID=3711 RepID=A0A8D9DFW3_BRACM|nr:unnamed protein product [Brassica rapa]